MKRRIKINLIDTNQLEKKVIDFFNSYDFQLIDTKEGFLRFRKNSSILDAWKTNPLQWGSEISVLISDGSIEAVFIVDTDAQMNTKEEKIVWQAFIERFKNFLVKGETDNSKLNLIISESKKSRLNYFGLATLGALTGVLLTFIYTRLTNNNSPLTLLIIPIMTTIFLSWRIKYERSKTGF